MKMPSWWPWVRRSTMEYYINLEKCTLDPYEIELQRELRQSARSNRSLRGTVTRLMRERDVLRDELASLTQRTGK